VLGGGGGAIPILPRILLDLRGGDEMNHPTDSQQISNLLCHYTFSGVVAG